MPECLELFMFGPALCLRSRCKVIPVKGISFRYIPGLIQQFRSPQLQVPWVGVIVGGLQ